MNEEKQELKSILYTHNECHDALMHIQDLLERSQIQFILLGETAKQIDTMDIATLELPYIHLGVLKKDWTQSGSQTFKSLAPSINIEDNIIDYEYNGVPIGIQIIDKDYPFFKNPDTRIYYLTEYKIPNPMSLYTEEMGNIK